MILHNYSTQKTPEIHRWLLRHPRFVLHFTPTGSSWLNLVERWFGENWPERLIRPRSQPFPLTGQTSRCWESWNPPSLASPIGFRLSCQMVGLIDGWHNRIPLRHRRARSPLGRSN
jgi:hypothetical protein